jgi:peptide/nickel transport system substrate-binding protein
MAYLSQTGTPMKNHHNIALTSLLAAGLAALLCVLPAQAKTLRWSSAGDMQTADPHAQNSGVNNNINGQIFEGLVERGKNMEIVPRLATSWRQPNPTTWVFDIRKNVKFHDGKPLTADDVVWSILRMQQPTSNFRVYANGIGKPRKIDSHTVELTTPVPNPVTLEMLVNMFIMSRDWAIANKVEKVQDYAAKEETFAARNANGTGPFMLVSREPEVKTVLKKNPNWWGIAEKKFEGNVTEVVYTPISSEATRMSALLSGEIDFVLDPAVQNLEQFKRNKALKVIQGIENRVVFFGMDQGRDELLYSNIKGKNPLKDKRVRQAMYQAIDIEAIKRTAMRGLSTPTGLVHPNPVAAKLPAELTKRLPFDIAAATKLMSDAGYASGFDITLDCPIGRYLADERICVSVAGMLAKINVRVRVNTMPISTYFAKIQKLDTSFYMLGWGGSTFEPIFTLQPIMHSRNTVGDGDYNYGQVKDAKFDALVQQVKGELDPKKRMAMIVEAFKIYNDNVYLLPLHLQIIPWAMRANMSAVHRADNWLEVPWVMIK